jgi:hypothetical protein
LGFGKIRYNGFGLGEGGVFTTNVDAENQTLINHKCVCGALNRHFCQTRVIGSPFLSVSCLSVHLVCRGALAGGSFAFFSIALCVGKNANVPPIALVNISSVLKSL